jgi:hypothetical protein
MRRPGRRRELGPRRLHAIRPDEVVGGRAGLAPPLAQHVDGERVGQGGGLLLQAGEAVVEAHGCALRSFAEMTSAGAGPPLSGASTRSIHSCRSRGFPPGSRTARAAPSRTVGGVPSPSSSTSVSAVAVAALPSASIAAGSLRLSSG